MIRTTISSARTVNMQVKDVKVEASARNLRLIRETVAGVALDPATNENGARLATAVACLDDLIDAAEKNKEAKQ